MLYIVDISILIFIQYVYSFFSLLDCLQNACENLNKMYGNRLKVDPIADDLMNVLPKIGYLMQKITQDRV